MAGVCVIHVIHHSLDPSRQLLLLSELLLELIKLLLGLEGSRLSHRSMTAMTFVVCEAPGLDAPAEPTGGSHAEPTGRIRTCRTCRAYVF